MKVVLQNDLLNNEHPQAEDFITELRHSFPSVNFCPANTEADQIREIVDAEVHFGEISPAVFQAANKLRWCHFIGAGFDRLVRTNPSFVASDVILTNAPGTHAIAMADHVMAMILAFAHRLTDLIVDQQKHHWDSLKYRGRMRELQDTTMGILALGAIGQLVAVRAQSFGIKVHAVDLKPMSPPAGVAEVCTLEGLDQLLQISDWFVVTAPLTNQTQGLINRTRIKQLKLGSHVIIISRGGIVDEVALAEGLGSGYIGGAAFDALQTEPLPPDSPFWDMPNVLISPHCSADSPQMWERRREIFKENLSRYLNGAPLLYVCDKRAGY